MTRNIHRWMLITALVSVASPAAGAEGRDGYESRPLSAAIAGAVSSEVARMAQQPNSDGGAGKVLMWTGVATMGAGVTLAILATTSLKEEYFDLTNDCEDFDGCTNKALVWTGIAIAGGGAALMAVGATRNTTVFVPLRGGGAVLHRRTLGKR